MRDDEFLDRPASLLQRSREEVRARHGSRDRCPNAGGIRRPTEQFQDLGLEATDEPRRIVAARADAAQFELPALVPSVVAVRHAEPMRHRRQKDDPAIPALYPNGKSNRRLIRSANADASVSARVGSGRSQSESTIPWTTRYPSCSAASTELGQQRSRVRIDRFMAFDPPEASVSVSLIAERGDEDPFQHLHAIEQARAFRREQLPDVSPPLCTRAGGRVAGQAFEGSDPPDGTHDR